MSGLKEQQYMEVPMGIRDILGETLNVEVTPPGNPPAKPRTAVILPGLLGRNGSYEALSARLREKGFTVVQYETSDHLTTVMNSFVEYMCEWQNLDSDPHGGVKIAASMTNIVAAIEKKYTYGIPENLQHFVSIVNGGIDKLKKPTGTTTGEILRLLFSQLASLDAKKGKDYMEAEIAMFPALIFWLRLKNKIGDDKVSVLGHGRGGALAAQLMSYMPGYVKAAELLDPTDSGNYLKENAAKKVNGVKILKAAKKSTYNGPNVTKTFDIMGTKADIRCQHSTFQDWGEGPRNGWADHACGNDGKMMDRSACATAVVDELIAMLQATKVGGGASPAGRVGSGIRR